jgi:colicin import membrane protein
MTCQGLRTYPALQRKASSLDLLRATSVDASTSEYKEAIQIMLSKEKATPSNSDRPENSVLFSLKELRRLENERVKAEADARRAQAEDDRLAKAEAEQRARDEETRRTREEEERRCRADSERQERQREDRLRVEEAERRARVEGELRLRERQLLAEQRRRHVQRRRFGRPAGMAAAAGAVLFVAIGGGLAAWASQQHQAEKKALEREIASRDDQARAAQLDFEAKIHALEEKAQRDVAEAKTAKDQARILGDLKRQKQALEGARPRPSRRTVLPLQPTTATPKPAFRVPQKPEIKDDPLGGDPAVKSGGF